MESIGEVWKNVCIYCKTKISEVTFNAWFKAISIKELSGKEVTLFVKSNFQRQIINENYLSLLNEAFEAVLKFPVHIKFLTEADIPNSPFNGITAAQYEYTFDTFIIGGSNRFAYATSLAVAEGTVTNYNPLFIWGNSGLGKTHLISAIATRYKQKFPEKKVLYITCEAFANEFFTCLQSSKMQQFRDKYRNVDMLLIDDIQFISGKISTEEEFFNTFNELKINHKQLVITSDRAPKDMNSLTERLITRFEEGMIADIQPPEYETRIGIIKRKAQLMNFDLSDEITTYVADQVKCNIRQLEGVVKKLQAHSLIYENLTIGVAEGIIRDIKKEDLPEPITIQKIVSEVSRVYGVSIEDIYSNKRDAEFAHARQVSMYIIRKVTELSYEKIGEEFGGKKHGTVLYSCRKLQTIIDTNPRESSKIEEIIKNVSV